MNLIDNFFNSFPIIFIEDIFLREIIPGKDYINYFKYINSEEVAAYLSKKDTPSSEEAAIIELEYWYRLFKSHHSIYWAIAEKSSNKIIGTCGYNYWNKEHHRAEISYDLDSNYWGKGIMTKAIEKIVAYGFEFMNLQRIQATVAVDNNRSIKVLEKLNFSQEGIMKKYCILNEEAKDFYMYGLVN